MCPFTRGFQMPNVNINISLLFHQSMYLKTAIKAQKANKVANFT